MPEIIRHGGELIAIILRSDYSAEGVHFFTPNDFSQQLAYMQHPRGRTIPPHVHNTSARSVSLTQEVLMIRRGVLRVDFYTDQKTYLESRILRAGDVILLASGGHGFEVIENLEMIEVKQGPYTGDGDKTRFDAIAPPEIRIVDERKPD